ncbi:unnamed protein product [Blepharisma stoltei]|uniref:Tetratricopeptide repeat protein n=1 Tax=Blepharisma stoltei TaxID=1481888 RepID=A0AAU9IPV2_9CILI|nr:unnamed protein product [Blepharisma stoltei]
MEANDSNSLLQAGITFLRTFMQENISGPPLNLPRTNAENLSLDGEDVITYILGSENLSNARDIFINQFSSIEPLQDSYLWRARYAFLHQQILTHQVESLKSLSLSSYEKALSHDFPPSEKALLLVEYSRCLLYYLQYEQSEQALLQAQELAGLSFNLTGKLGVRTKFQTFKTAQLVLETRSSEEITNVAAEAPVSIKLDEDCPLHETPQLDQPSLENCSIADQIILLAWVNYFFKTKPKDELQTEIIASYLDKILEKPLNWLVYSEALLYRSKNQFESYKHKERSALQIQTLLDQFSDESPDVVERLSYVFSLNYPLRHWLKVELGEMFMKLGAPMSAFQEFETVEMWEDAVECLIMSNYSGKAEKLANERLSIHKTPRMLCALGDISRNLECYLEAWEISNHRYTRSQRSLARISFDEGNFEKAIEHYKLALEINPLYANCWFTLGCAQMKLQKWEDAALSFRKLVHVDGTIAEGWNNLAASYIQMEKYEEAFTAMYHGVKYDRMNWKMWENLLILSIQVRKISQTIESIRSLLRLNQTRNIDEKVFVALNWYSNETQRWQEVEKVYSEVVNKISINGRSWKCYADFVEMYQGINEDFSIERVLNLRLKACRAVLGTPSWEKDSNLCSDLILFGTELAECYKRVNENMKIEGRLFIENIKKKFEEKLEKEVEFPNF